LNEVIEVRQLFRRMFQRPLVAVTSSLTLIGQHSSARQLMDGIVSRFVYALVKIERNDRNRERRR
jgi:hypothetical protein